MTVEPINGGKHLRCTLGFQLFVIWELNIHICTTNWRRPLAVVCHHRLSRGDVHHLQQSLPVCTFNHQQRMARWSNGYGTGLVTLKSCVHVTLSELNLTRSGCTLSTAQFSTIREMQMLHKDTGSAPKRAAFRQRPVNSKFTYMCLCLQAL